MNNYSSISLKGNWFFVEDKDSSKDISEIINYDKVMNIPSNWELEGLHNFNGSVWYIKEFELEKIADSTFLEFKGVDYISEVWLNNKYLGKHEGYFSPFVFNISNFIKNKNILIVKVTSPYEQPETVWPLHKKIIKGIFNHHDCRPGGWSYKHGQDMNTGGIWNDVIIHSGISNFITKCLVTSKINDKAANINLNIDFLGDCNTVSNKYLTINISNKNFNKEIIAKISHPDKNNLNIKFSVENIELWNSYDTGTPVLYDFKISSDEFNNIEFKYGFRTVKLNKNEEFFLNNKKLFLKGTNLIPDQFLSRLSKDKIKQIANLIKDANVNIVRVHAHVNREELYEAFDEAGILVWQDFALQWTYDESKEFSANAVTQIKEMVNLLYNHPSIAFWCCHNEPGEQINTLDVLLENAVYEIDKQRIIRRASNYEEHPYEGWYWGKKEDYISTPMGPLVTEFGAQAIPRLNSLTKFINKNKLYPPDVEEWEFHDFQFDQTFNIAKVNPGNSIEEFVANSQKYQADVIKTAIHYYRRKKYNPITGIFQFMFYDCWESISWSVVDFYFNKKSGFDALKKGYQAELLSINLRQNQYFENAKLNVDIYIINDTFNKHNYDLVFESNGKEFYKMNNILVEKDSVLTMPFDKLNINFNKDMRSNCSISAKLIKNGNEISKEEFLINVIKKDFESIKSSI